jgi:hypothetical protein
VAQKAAIAGLMALVNRFDRAADRYKDFYPTLVTPVQVDPVPGMLSEFQVRPIGLTRFETAPRGDEAVDEFRTLARLALKHLLAVDDAAADPTVDPPIAWLKVVYEQSGRLACLESVEPPEIDDERVEPPPADQGVVRRRRKKNPERPIGWQERLVGESNAFRLSAVAISQILARHDAPQPPEKPTGPPWIISHGGATYSIGDSEQTQVTKSDDALLQAFIGNPRLATNDIIGRSRVKRPAAALQRLSTKYGGIFAPAIAFPGSKGEGGYRVLVRRNNA